MRFLRHKAFHTPQISGVHLPNVPAGDAHRAAGRVPEAHQQAQQRGFAAAAAPRNAHHAALRDAQAHTGEDWLFAVREAHILTGCAGKGGGLPAGDLMHQRFLIQDIQHTVACGQRILQRTAQICQRYHRPKGAHQCGQRDEHAVESHRAGKIQPRGCGQHSKAERQNDGVRQSHAPCRAPLHAFLGVQQAFCALLQPCQAVFALMVLQHFAQAAQAVQYIAAQRSGLCTELCARIAAQPCDEHRQRRTHRQVCRRGQQTQQRMVSTDEHTHADRHHKRDGCG